MLLAISATGLFSSCAKIVDFKKHHPGIDAHSCRIQKFFLRYYDASGVPGGTRELDVAYDKKGRPVSITPVREPYIYYVTRFAYDDYNRLIDYRLDGVGGPNPTDSVFIYEHRYSYGLYDRIIDTSYQLSQDFPAAISTLWLDTAGRVVNSGLFYNAAGNMVRYDDITGDPNYIFVYDNKVNWRQLSKTWQLIDFNYSVNNATNALDLNRIVGYNIYGLPLEFRQKTTGNNGMLFNAAYRYDVLDIQYACDPGPGPGGHGY